jgi:hypothetical protein
MIVSQWLFMLYNVLGHRKSPQVVIRSLRAKEGLKMTTPEAECNTPAPASLRLPPFFSSEPKTRLRSNFKNNKALHAERGPSTLSLVGNMKWVAIPRDPNR